MQRQSVTDPRPGLTKRQTEVLERLERGTPVKGIAQDIGVTPAAVYQTIERLRRSGHLPEDFTPSGERPRRTPAPGPGTIHGQGTASRLAEMRDWESHDGDAALIEAAIVAGDVPALAYCLGRADAGDEDGLRRGILEAALRRLGVLGGAEARAGTGGTPTRKRGAP